MKRREQYTARSHLSALWAWGHGLLPIRVKVWKHSTVARSPKPGERYNGSPCGCQLLQGLQPLPEPLLHHAQLGRGLGASEGLGSPVKLLHGAPKTSQFLLQGLPAHKAQAGVVYSSIHLPTLLIIQPIDHTPILFLLPLTHPPTLFNKPRRI